MPRTLQVYITSALGELGSSGFPTGGGVVILERLLEAWKTRQDIAITVVAPGRVFCEEVRNGIRWVLLPIPILQDREIKEILHATSLRYARFSMEIEKAVTDYLVDQKKQHPDTDMVVLANDTAEGPDFRALYEAGIRQAAIFHVGVVEFFVQQYLHNVLPAAWLTKLYRVCARLKLAPLLPRILQLVFVKESHAMQYADYVIVPSQGLADVLRRLHPGVPANRLQVVPWGAPFVSSAPSIQQGELADFGIQENDKVLLTMSRLSPEKGLERLMRALRLWSRQSPDQVRNLVVLISGRPAYMGGDAYAKKIRAMAEALPVRVQFPGYLEGPAKRMLLERADLFVNTSRYESYGLGIMEAMAHGTPVVAWASHGSSQTLQEGGGVIVNSEQELANALSGLLQYPHRMEDLQSTLRNRAPLSDFSKAADAILALL